MHTAVTIAVILVALAFIDQVLYLDITRLGWRRAKSAMPEIARKLSLTYEPATQQHHMGTIHGKYRGRYVRVDPDCLATIRIELPGLSYIRLSTSDPRRLNIPERMTSFDSGNISFDRFFRSRLAAVPLHIHPDFHASNTHQVEQFSKSWKSRLRYLKLSNGVLTGSFKYGQASYIPTTLIERFLSELVLLADALESMLASSNNIDNAASSMN